MAWYGLTAAVMKATYGVPSTINDGIIEDRLEYWQAIIERYCRQWFESRLHTLKMKGNDAHTLLLPMALVDTTGLKVYLNEDTSPLGSDVYEVGVDKNFHLDRHNPRIILKRDPDFYSRILTRSWIFSSRYMQQIEGNFGYVEDDGSTPLPIVRALAKLVVLDLKSGETFWDGGGSGIWPGPGGPIKKETTDGHSIEYGVSDKQGFTTGIDPLIPDREAKAILTRYMAPIAVGWPGKP